MQHDRVSIKVQRQMQVTKRAFLWLLNTANILSAYLL